jgi:hypothetical protein
MKIIASATITLAAVMAANAADMPLNAGKNAAPNFRLSTQLRSHRCCELLSVRQSWREAYLHRQFDEGR